jgi:steroid 5-alpha reductase family enzyme
MAAVDWSKIALLALLALVVTAAVGQAERTGRGGWVDVLWSEFF